MSFIKESKKAYSQVKENHIAIAMGNMLDDEGSMILNQIEELERGIEMLRTYVGNDYEKQLPAWVQSKVTLATDYISTVGNYLSSKNEKVTEETIKESSDLTESTFEKIYQMQQDGKSTEDIAKELKLNPALVKKVLGEQVELKEFNDAQIALLKKEFDPLKNKQISTARANQLSNILDKLDDGSLQKLRDALIPFVSAVSAAKLTTRKFKGVKITNVKVPGLEGMAEESSYWWHDGKSGYVKASDSDKDLVAWLKKNGYKPEKDIKKEEAELQETTPLQTANTMMKTLAAKAGIKPATSNAGYQAIYDYKNGEGSFKGQGKKSYEQVKNWIYKNGYDVQIGFLKQIMGEQIELKPVPSLEDSAKKHKVDVEVLKKQLEKGIEIEKEHTKDEKVAEKIALAHIDERPDYYDQLAKVEKQPVDEACWTGYKQVGLKKKGKKMVPNCVPEETVKEVKEPTGELKDACWKDYVAVGFKMKNGKRVPNCVPKSEAYKGAKAVVENAFKKLKEKNNDKIFRN